MRAAALAGSALAALLLVGPAAARAEVGAAEDLAVVIELHGKPCGKVTSVQRRGDKNYVARCAGGQKYHVYVDGAGRTRVDKS